MRDTSILLFDLDGTLLETIGDIAATLNAVLTEEGGAPLDPESIRAMVGAGARVLIRRGLDASGAPAPDAERIERLFRRFVAIYADNIAVHTYARPGLIEVLDSLRGRGVRMAVLTNKQEALAVKVLGALGLADRFSTIVGGDSFAFQKPDPRIVPATLARAGANGARAVMIGDSRTDLDTARAAAIPCILVDFGYTETPARALGADRVISDWAELEAAVEKVLV